MLKGLQFQSDCGIIAFAVKESGIKTKYRGVEQLVARRAHNPKVVGSSPSPATKNKDDFLQKIVFIFALFSFIFLVIYFF